MSTRFAHKIAIVTGAGNGIGTAIATRIAGEGAAVVVADKDEAAAQKVAGEIVASGGKAAACRVDICVPADAEAMVAFARSRFGPVQIMINNAGLGSQRHFLETPLEMLRLMLDTNVVGTFLCAQAAAREMAKNGGGAIVNFSSHSGFLGSSGRAAYAASKAGIIGMTRVMAVDLAQHNIRVNTVAPGTVATPRIKASHNDERRDTWLRTIPMARYGEPEEIAAAALFLASDDAAYMTGQTIAVDGGFTIAGLRVKDLAAKDGSY
jgi:NAD(P)-dependent dehydrogenase (short-subunit alcohol dehydrogenase family)